MTPDECRARARAIIDRHFRDQLRRFESYLIGRNAFEDVDELDKALADARERSARYRQEAFAEVDAIVGSMVNGRNDYDVR